MSHDTGPHGEALGLVRGSKGEGKARIKAFVVVFPYPWVSHLWTENIKKKKNFIKQNLNLLRTKHYTDSI